MCHRLVLLPASPHGPTCSEQRAFTPKFRTDPPFPTERGIVVDLETQEGRGAPEVCRVVPCQRGYWRPSRATRDEPLAIATEALQHLATPARAPFLVRVGADGTEAGGRTHGVVDTETGEFVYVPIPERRPVKLGLETPYSDLAAPLLRA